MKQANKRRGSNKKKSLRKQDRKTPTYAWVSLGLPYPRDLSPCCPSSSSLFDDVLLPDFCFDFCFDSCLLDPCLCPSFYPSRGKKWVLQLRRRPRSCFLPCNNLPPRSPTRRWRRDPLPTPTLASPADCFPPTRSAFECAAESRRKIALLIAAPPRTRPRG